MKFESLVRNSIGELRDSLLQLSIQRRCMSSNLAETPIHYQEPKQLLKTVVRGSKTRNVNSNFWRRCANAVVYNIDSYSTPDLVQIIKAFAHANHSDKSFYNSVASRIISLKDEWQVGDLPQVLYEYCISNMYHGELFKIGLKMIVNNTEHISPEAISQTMSSLVCHEVETPLIDTLVKPIFKNISQFSTNNLVHILKAIDHMQYKNEALLQLLAHHFNGQRVEPSFCVLKAFDGLGYVDANVVDIVHKFISTRSHFMDMSNVPELVRVIVNTHLKRPLDMNCFNCIIRLVTRNSDSVSVHTVFGVKYAMDTVGVQDVYLDSLYNHLRTNHIDQMSLSDKLEVLRKSVGFPLELVYLYDAIMESIDTGIGHPRKDSLPSTIELIEVMHWFNKLGYIKGLGKLMVLIQRSGIHIEGPEAIKCHEIISRYLTPSDMFNKALEGNVSEEQFRYSKVGPANPEQRCSEARDASSNVESAGISSVECSPLSSDIRNNGGPGGHSLNNVTLATDCASHNHATNNASDTYRNSAMTMDYFKTVSKDEADAINEAYHKLTLRVNNCDSTSLALGICHAESLDYVIYLANKLELGSSIDSEVIPAMMRNVVVLSLAKRQHCKRIYELQEWCINKVDIASLSAESFATLSSVVTYITNPSLSSIVPSMIQHFVESYPVEHPRFSSTALKLLKLCTLNQKVDHKALCRHVCMNVGNINPHNIDKLMEYFLELGYNEQAYIVLIEGALEDAIVIDSNMTRVSRLEHLGEKLGLKCNTVTYSNP